MKAISIHTLILLFAATVLLSGCTNKFDEEFDLPYDASQPVSFTAQVNSVTRGTPISSASELTSMGVFCAATGQTDWSVAAAMNKMFNERLNNNSGNWTYQNSNIYWEAADITDRYSFFAYTPYASSENGITVNGSSTAQGKPTLSYTVPNDVTKQPDLMVAVPRYNVRPTSNNVALQMKHALAAVGFRISGNNERISDISITGVSVSGELVMDGSNIQWYNLSNPTNIDYSALINFDAGKDYFTATGEMNDLITGNGYLMMIPQALGENAKLVITFSDNTIKEISLNTYVWAPGTRVMYNITSAGIITITPNEIILPNIATSSESLTVNCKNAAGIDANIPWTLTVPAGCDWLELSLNSNGTGATKTLTGTGQATVYLVASANSSVVNTRWTYVYLGPEIDDNSVLTVIQSKSAPPENVPVDARNSCAGAFWRHNQTGERIVQINVGNNGGLWSAKVLWYDSKWSPLNGDGIIFSTEGSYDEDLNTDYPGNAEDFQVTNGVSFVSGVVNNDGHIMFRIGLQKTFQAYNENTNPARYAIIELYYNNYNKVQKIYIRQGEGADYLINKQNTFGTRPLAAKFSPFNLTAATLDAQVPQRGGTFTEYPSQVGAFFEWASNNQQYQRYAWSPHVNYAGGFTPNTPANFNSNHETSPVGFRRPKEGQNDSQAYPKGNAFANSEIRQSLFLEALENESTSSPSNVLFGYYADGFYDRRPVSHGPYINSSGYVSGTNANIACGGRLFFNPDTNASLFFPAGGYLYATGELRNVGYIGSYWTSSTETYQVWALNMQSMGWTAISMIMKNTSSDRASSIRCVKDE